MEQPQSFAYDMATMALKGKRFKEAEQEFKELAMQTNSVEAWCGMALSKFGLILEDVTVAEVFYCFDKAKSIATDDSSNELYVMAQQSSFECASQLYNLYINAVLATRHAIHRKNVAVVSTIVGSFSTIEAVSRNKTMGAIASAGFTALNYNSYLQSHSSAEQLKQVQSHVVNIIEEIKGYVKAFLGEESEKWKEFVSLTEKRQQEVIETLKTEDQRAYEKATGGSQQVTNNYVVQKLLNKDAFVSEKERTKYLEEKHEELKDVNHPFHFIKEEAKRLFKLRMLDESLKFANLAATYFSEDQEIKMIQDYIIKKKMRLFLVIALPIWVVISLMIGVSLDSDKGGAILFVTGVPVLLFIIWKSYRLKTNTIKYAEMPNKPVTQSVNQ